MAKPQRPKVANSHLTWVIRSGIPSIDGMFRISEHEATDIRGGISLPEVGATSSIAIVGPQGAGKSVLAMHFAARYSADCHAAFASGSSALPRVCYVSTDMTYSVTRPMQRRFGLDEPNNRQVPFADYQQLTAPDGSLLVPEWLAQHVDPPPKTLERSLRIELLECPADDPKQLAQYLLNGSRPSDNASSASHSGHTTSDLTAQVAFVDLASRTAGDDWAFVHRLLSVLPTSSHQEGAVPRHMVVIDAVEGLETFGGDLDAFGEPSLRRARVAKLIRLAAERCHLVLVVEEAKSDSGLPEEFVSDVVFHLKNVDAHDYLRRTLQIEKARGQSTVRGRHPYVLRSGRGSTTGDAENYDDPRILSATGEFQSYVELFPSLHYESRNLMGLARSGTTHDCETDEAIGTPGNIRKRLQPRQERAGFGIEYLDEMLAEQGAGAAAASDLRGLPCSTITALIGDAGTQKTGLGIAFLGQAFGRVVDELLKVDATNHDVTSWDVKIESDYSELAGVPILITTHNENSSALAEFFIKRLLPELTSYPWLDALRRFIVRRTICRRLEIHDMPSAVLFNIVKRAIEAGQRTAVGGNPHPLKRMDRPLSRDVRERFEESWRIRLVIDDLSTIMDTYAQVRSDPLFVPFLVNHLRREGLTSLIIDTRTGRPDEPSREDFHTDLRALSDHRLYTWPVKEFFGDHRVAIAAIPPIARDHRPRVREIKRMIGKADSGKGELFVDPVFELYAGLEENRPELVPLEVRLYGETKACRDYAMYLDEIFRRTFQPDRRRTESPGQVVVSEQPEDYDLIRDPSYLTVDTRLERTLIVQIDEFWRRGYVGGDLERKYLTESVDREQPREELDIRDPFHTYRESQMGGKNVSYRKADYFDIPACSLEPEQGRVDRVPFLWDFGFMACSAGAWERAAVRNEDVREFWRRYHNSTDPDAVASLTWPSFLRHAATVASLESTVRRRYVPALDFAGPSGESFSCLMLEVWLSEILLTLKKSDTNHLAPELVGQLSQREWSVRREGGFGLSDLLRSGERKKATGEREVEGFPGWSLELYKAWLLLVESVDLDRLSHLDAPSRMAANEKSYDSAVAVRHWYKTACAISEEDRALNGTIHFGRLPGSFSTRGDWYLAVAPESRSYPLGSRALDLLCSIRGNLRRLERGVGLPVRRLRPEGNSLSDSMEFRTGLITDAGPSGTPRYMSYTEVLELGPQSLTNTPSCIGDLGWLWRSGLRNYHRHAITWQSWLFRTARYWAHLKKAKYAGADKNAESDPWKSGFDVYDAISRPRGSGSIKYRDLESFIAFPAQVKPLLNELKLLDASTRDPSAATTPT